MKDQKREQIKVDISILRPLLEPVESNLYKINNLIEEHYKDRYSFYEYDLTNLLELKISSEVLVSYLSDLCLQAETAGVSELYLYPEEIKMVATLAKTLNSAYNVRIGNTNLREH